MAARSSRWSGFLRYLHRIERSPNTVRAYAHDLRLFCEFLAGRGLAWDAVARSRIWGISRRGCAARRRTWCCFRSAAGAVTEHDQSGAVGGDGVL